MLSPKFSIIIPMYNVEKFLPACIDSVRSQKLSDIEIILVDDGSPDRCGEIADAYARIDSRIKVIHKENGGLGPARNSGMEIAEGEYVAFLDSDDWVEPCMYELLYNAAARTRAQVIYSGIKTVSQGVVTQIQENPFAGRLLCGQDEIFQLRCLYYGAAATNVDRDPAPLSACIAGYNRRFLNDNGIVFRNVLSEDIFFNVNVTRCAERVACISGAHYCYRKDGQPSISESFSLGKELQYFSFFAQIRDLAEEEPAKFREGARIRANRRVIDYARALVRIVERSSLSNHEKSYCIRDICNNPNLLEACKGFPFWRLPFAQSAFYLCLQFHFVSIARLLVRIREYVR